MADYDWKIMVYLSGDNNLSEAMVNAITDMRKNLALNNRIALYAYYDSNAPGYPSVLFDFTKKTGGIAQDGSDLLPEITSLGRDIRTSTSSIYRFVEWCTKDRPTADHHALILSGHGDAFQKDNFLKDSGDGGYISVRGLAKTLNDINSKLLPSSLSVLGLDCCVMSSIEVAFQMQPFVEYLLSSQGLVPDRGWNYGGMLDALSATYADEKASVSPRELCELLREAYLEGNRDFCDFSARSVDMSICEMAQLSDHGKVVPANAKPKLAESINQLADALIKGLKNEQLGRKLSSAVLAAHWRCQTYLYDQCADIMDFAAELKTELSGDESNEASAIRHCCDLVDTAAKACATSDSIGAEYQWSNGLSIYFPWSFYSYKILRKQYKELDFALEKRRYEIIDKNSSKRTKEQMDALQKSESKWLSFLDEYLYMTLRPVRETSETPAYILGLQEPDIAGPKFNLRMASVANDKVNDPKDKVNDPYDKVNDPYDRVNDPKDRLNSYQWENFRRFKNFPWAPKEWTPPKSAQKAPPGKQSKKAKPPKKARKAAN